MRWEPCWPTTWRGPAWDRSGSSTATSSRPTTSSARSSSTRTTSPTTCPRPRRPRASSGRSTARSTVEPVVTDIDHTNILDLVGDADLILDGTDNFETRYLINDAAVKLDKPWIYGGVIGSEGQTMTIVPGKTPCLRCLIETAPPPGMTPTCETAGVLGPAVAVIASFEAIEAIKLLERHVDALNVNLIMVDVWDWTFRQLKVAGLLGQGRLPVLRAAAVRVARRGHGLAHDDPVRPQRRPGRRPARPSRSISPSWPRGSTASATVRHNAFMLRFATDGYEFTVFPDGRAIIKGTNDVAKARTLYAQFVGN